MKGTMLAILISAVVSSSAWALYEVDEISQTWTGSPMPNGGTVYSNGLDTVEVSPSGPYSSSYSAWSANGQNTIGSISGPSAGSVPPLPLLFERHERSSSPSKDVLPERGDWRDRR